MNSDRCGANRRVFMSRFFSFFLVSFLLHMAMGAVLLSRTGLLGSGGEDQVELNDLQETPEEAGQGQTPQSVEKKSSKKSETLETEIKQKEVKPRAKPKKKVQKKKKPAKPKLAKPAPASSKAEPVIKEAVEEKKEPSVEKSEGDEVENKPESEKIFEEVKEASSAEQTQKEKEVQKEEWADEGEQVEEEEPVAEKLKQAEEGTDSPAPAKKEAPDQEKEDEKKPAPPQNEQTPSSTNSSGADYKEAPSLDVKAARVYTQLRQREGNPVPVYPEEALKKKWEGRVEVLYYVNPAGFVEKIQLKNSSGHSVLDNSALRALARYRYYPGQEGWVRHPVEFFLEMDKEVKETAPLGLRKSASQK